MKVSLSSTSEYSAKAAESISDLNPNAADVLITSVLTSMVTDLGLSLIHISEPTRPY